jgi:hypothetical protein
MEHEADNPENVPRHTDEQDTQCAQGSEIFSPRDLTAYLRTYGEHGKLPPEVKEHLADCRICGENWAFIERTDPILKKFRRDRVKLLITSVLADEDPLPIAAEPSEKVGEDRPILVEDLQQALSRPQSFPGADVIDLDELVQPVLGTGELSSDKVLATCRKVQEIPDDGIRYLTSKRVSAGFEVLADREQERGTIPNDSIVDQLMNRNSGWVDLSKLGVPLERAMFFVASLPQTSYFRNPDLFQQSGHTILFNVGRFPQLLSEFEQLGSRFERVQSPRLMD